MEVEIVEPSGNDRVMVPRVEGGRTAYRFQRCGRTQQEGSVHEANLVGFGEGSPDPSYC